MMKSFYFKIRAKTILYFLGIVFFLLNCSKEEETSHYLLGDKVIETVSASDATAHFLESQNKYKTLNSLKNSKKEFKIKPDWKSYRQKKIYHTDAKLSIVDVNINRNGNFKAYMFFVKVNGKIKNVVFSLWSSTINDENDFDSIDALAFFNTTNGHFLDAYRIENGIYTKRMIPRNKKYKSNAMLLAFLQEDDEEDDCWNTDCLPGAEVDYALEEVDLGSVGANGGGFDPNTYTILRMQSFINNTVGANSTTSGGNVISGAGTILTNTLNETTEDNDNEACFGGKIMDDTGNCVCPEGFVEDENGECAELWPEDLILFENLPNGIINDIEYYLNCFKEDQIAELTIYVDQPIANSSVAFSGFSDPDVGHTFIALSQGNVQRVFGFYPSEGVKPKTDVSVPSVFVNDSGHVFDVSLTVPLSNNQLINVLNSIKSTSNIYNLNDYNCTDVGMEIFNSAGFLFKLDDAEGWWPGGNGSNPGALGQEIRKMLLPDFAIRNSRGGLAMKNNGDCK